VRGIFGLASPLLNTAMLTREIQTKRFTWFPGKQLNQAYYERQER
jgi:hypothetical protein